MNTSILILAAVLSVGAGKQYPTIQSAAERAKPGDMVLIADGIYRERVDPKHSGTASKPIIYRAEHPGKVVISGSEVIERWEKIDGGLWKTHIADSWLKKFGDFNPFTSEIAGDFFIPGKLTHHRSMLVVEGERCPMTDDTLEAIRKSPDPNRNYPLVNFRGFGFGERNAIAAGKPSAMKGPKSKGDHLEYIFDGAWATYKEVQIDGMSAWVEVASGTAGGLVEIRAGGTDGEILTTINVPKTANWGDYRKFPVSLNGYGGKETLTFIFRKGERKSGSGVRWTALREGDGTTIYARLPIDPNVVKVETAVREELFYPSKEGINYITLEGVVVENGCPQWAPPTAEQKALIGTHWSKGWKILNCEVRNSSCTGITLGKWGDEFDNCDGQDSQAFTNTIARASLHHWNLETIGSHTVSGCHIHHCGQSGLVGSFGAIGSTIEKCHIHDIYVGERFKGWEQACIKLHAAIDVKILGNKLERCNYWGIWLDWMAQGTLIKDNDISGMAWNDIFLEVVHGPVTLENNFLASPGGLLLGGDGVMSVGNVIVGKVNIRHGDVRRTPYFKPHSTEVANMTQAHNGGDCHFLGNVSSRSIGPFTNYNLKCRTIGNVVKENPTRADLPKRPQEDWGMTVWSKQSFEIK